MVLTWTLTQTLLRRSSGPPPWFSDPHSCGTFQCSFSSSGTQHGGPAVNSCQPDTILTPDLQITIRLRPGVRSVTAIQDFLGVEDQFRMWEVECQLGEEMEIYQILVNHNVLGCQNCNLLVWPIQYCGESQYYPSHLLHQCPLSQACSCLE